MEASATVVTVDIGGGVEEERIVAGSGDGSVYCFRGSDGKVMWSTRLGKVRIVIIVIVMWSTRLGKVRISNLRRDERCERVCNMLYC